MNEKIAIIGLGCKCPGASNAQEFWRVLKDGENHVIEIPNSRWFHDAVYHEDFNTPAKTHTRKAGLLQDNMAFDNKFFNIKDVEADKMDPQQRYVLECVHMALEDAGITRDEIKGSKTSVYVGAMNTDYRSEFDYTSAVPDNYTVTGATSSIISNRVAYVYDLRGAAVTVDTACSSSLVAIHLGILALRAGDCDMVLCGGCNSILSPDIFISLSKAGMISAKGQCFSFSDQVDGYARGEGCGMVILKRLHDAKKDNNKIWATIEAGCNQDGATVAPISKPSEEQQTRLLEEVYSKYKINPNLLDYIEAHGTGTPVGDVVEVNALRKFFQNSLAERCRYIGSVKTNIGHLESAAGVAGLIKVLLMMKYSTIVPSLHFQNPNPKIDFHGAKLTVPTKLIDWESKKKVACVSSYGFGGTNSHAVVESYDNLINEHTASENNSDCVVCFSGLNIESLNGSMKDFVQFPDVKSMNIYELSVTSTIHRDHFPVRQAFVAETTQSLLTQITDQMNHLQHDSTDTKKPNIVFIFCGMGTAWAGMGRDFISKSNVYRESIKAVDKLLREYVSWSVEDRLMSQTDMNDQLFWPIAIFSCQIALANLWKSLGVTPASVVGYSVGEVAAAHVAGYLSLSDAVKVIYHRTNILTQSVGVGNMIIVKGVDIEKVDRVVKQWPDKANISARISPKACAVSGEIDNINTIMTEIKNTASLQNIDIQVIDLKLPLAYHSHCVDKCKEELRKVLNDSGLSSQQEGNADMISTVTGEKVNSPMTTEYWVSNIREPVCFLDAVRKTVKADGNNVFIEVGPNPVMAAHAKDIFPKENVQVIISMRSQRKWKTFLQAMASLYKHGCSLTWRSLLSGGYSIMPIPQYSFNARRVLHRSETAMMVAAGLNSLKREHPFLFRVETTNQFKIFLSAPTFQSVFSHNVSGNLIIPGALYVECGFALSQRIFSRKAAQYSISATFEQPCLFTEKEPVVLDLKIQTVPNNNSANHYETTSISVLQGQTLYATVHLHPHYIRNDRKAINIPQIMNQCQTQVERRAIYQKLVSFGFNFGPFYKLLMGARKTATECIVELCLPGDLVHEIPGTTVHPSILDAMIQTFIVFTSDDAKEEVLPLSVGKVTSFRRTESQMYIYTKVKECSGDVIVTDSKLTTLTGEVIAEMENIKLKLLSPTLESVPNDRSTENITKFTWILKEIDYPRKENLDQHVLYISDEPLPENMISIEYTTRQDCSDTITQQLDILKSENRLQELSYIILNISLPFHDLDSANNIQSNIVNLFMVLKSVFIYPLKIPVYVFTRWAIHTEHASLDTENTNPAMTAAWGLIRSALIEQSADISVFDIHLPDSQCSLERMTAVSEFVHTRSDLILYKEWIVTENSLFINQMIPLNRSKYVPTFRHISADKHRNVIQISNGTLDSMDTFNVYDDSKKSDAFEDKLQITVSDAVLQHLKLFNMSVPFNMIESYKKHWGNRIVVFALETIGTREDNDLQIDGLEDRRKHEVVSCYPSPVGPKISVPSCATVPKDFFSDYSAGDLTRLSMLMSLCEHITGSSVTILTSVQSRGLAENLLDMLICRDTLEKPLTINVINVEDLQTVITLNSTVVSLVLLDTSLMSIMTEHWQQAEYLITVTALLNQDVKSLCTYHLPSVRIITLDSFEIYQPTNITKLVPKVKKWLANRTSHGSLGAHTSITGPFPEVTADLNDLLKVQSLKVDRSVVRVDETSLFKKYAVYIVVGGLTGLGWIIVKFLSLKGAGNIAILNRRSPTEKNRQEIEELCESNNCNIKCFQCNVCETESIKQTLASICSAFPKKTLKGIFFGAAVTLDAILSNVTKENLAHVMSPKILGAWNLHKLTQDHNLDYFVLHSSLTSVIGNFGQTGYGAANAFLDGLASYRRHMNLPAQSINWGPLSMGLLEDNEKAQQLLKSRGLKFLTEKEIMSLMTPILLLDLDQIVACRFENEVWSKNIIITSSSSASHKALIDDALHRDVQRARELTQEDRLEVYIRLLIIMTSSVLGVDETSIKPDSYLQNMGMDSLLAMTVRHEIYKLTQCRLSPVVLISGDVTVKAIAKALDADMQKEIANSCL